MSHQFSIEHPTHITADPSPPQNLQHEMLPRSHTATHTPPEVLSYIFRFLVPFDKLKVDITLPAKGPFCLTQVCRHWRMIAESDPHLWSFMHFFVPKDSSRPIRVVRRVKLMFDLHLKRSGTLPISLEYLDHRNTTRMDELIFLLVDELQMHSRRWKSISLRLPHAYFPHLLTFTPCDLSSLEHLHISSDMYRSEFDGCLNLGSAKNLKSFAYRGPGDSLVKKINLNWKQLEEASFSDEFEGLAFGHLQCLVLCRNLITCSLDTRNPKVYPILGLNITLPRLQTLRVRLSDKPNEDTIIRDLFLPQLQTLEIDSETSSPHVPPLRDGYKISNLLERSKCSLRHLSIQWANLPSDEILRCLELSGMLLSFHYIPCPLSRDDIEDVFLKLKVLPFMVRGQTLHEWTQVGNRPLVPELRELTLGTSIRAYFDVIMAVFRSRGGSRARAAGAATLERVKVVFLDDHYEPPPEEVAGIRMDLAQWVSEKEKEKKTGVVAHLETRRLR